MSTIVYMPEPTYSREELLYGAKLSEYAEKYHDMVVAMKLIAEHENELTTEERSLLSIAYKNILSACRSSWRTVSSFEFKTEGSGHERKLYLITLYRQHLEKEIIEICNDVLILLEDFLLKNATTPETKVFYLKMQGDYYRYYAEVASGQDRKRVVEGAERAYNCAAECAETDLPTANPVRLGLALNMAIFQYEVKNNITAACELATKAFDAAFREGEPTASDAKDSTLIMQLLRDNLALWNAEQYSEDADF